MNNDKQRDERKYDRVIKLVMVGDSGVGKSSILLRFTENTFTNSYISTIGVDFKIRTLMINEKIYKIQIWDTAGQERFKSIVSSYYRGAHGVMYVYDVACRDSFNNLDRWINDVQTKTLSNDSESSGIEELLIGNKTDTNSRSVTCNEGKKYADYRDMNYIEVCALTGASVEDAFIMLIRTIVKKYPTDNTTKRNTVIENKYDVKTRNDCC